MKIKSAMALIGMVWLSVVVATETQANDQEQPDSPSPSDNRELTIIRMSSGTEHGAGSHAIVFTFNREVVPLGRMERSADEIPISIVPAVKCQWRWRSRSALACMLDDNTALSVATHYRIDVRPGIRTEDGVTLSEMAHFEFTTQKPQVEYANFNHWAAPDWPTLRITFNQPVSKASVSKSLGFSSGGKIIVLPDTALSNEPVFLPAPGESYGFLRTDPQQRVADDQLHNPGANEARRVWLISPTEGLGEGKTIGLEVHPGLQSALGNEPGDENRRVIDFDTYPDFRFLGTSCTPKGQSESVLLPPDSSANTLCEPLHQIALVFSAPVLSSEIKKHVRFAPDLAGGRDDYDPWANSRDYSHLQQPHQKNRSYSLYIPTYLKADNLYQLASKVGELHDEFGRSLRSGIAMHFKTDHRAPRFVFEQPFTVLEKNVASEPAVYVTNLKSLNKSFTTMTATGSGQSTLNTPIPTAQDVSFRIPLGLHEMLKGNSGAVSGSFTSTPSASTLPRDFFSVITPWQVHAKLGHFNSLAWLVDMSTGKPVANAKIQIFIGNYLHLDKAPAILAEAMTVADGSAMLPGRVKLDPKMTIHGCDFFGNSCLMVKVTKDNDMALLPLDYTFNADQYSWYGNNDDDSDGDNQSHYGVSTVPEHHHIHSWGLTAQGIYHAGDMIDYKIYVRDQDNQHFIPAPKSAYSLSIEDPTGNEIVHTDEIALNEFGSFAGKFKVDKAASVGWYRFKLTSNFTNKSWAPLSVLVADFTPASFHVSADLNAQIYRPGDTLKIDSHARLHAGGPYADAASRISVEVRPASLSLHDQALQSFYFDWFQGSRSQQTLDQHEGKLDKKGDMSSSIHLADNGIYVGKISVETAIRDDRGKYIASTTEARYIGRSRFVGLKTGTWLQKTGELSHAYVAVVDDNGKSVAGDKVAVDVEREDLQSVRVKGAGNVYMTQIERQWVAVQHCEVIASLTTASCDYTPPLAGDYRIRASVTDTKGRTHSSQISSWVIGSGYVLWDMPDNNNLPVYPEATRYKVGETARLLVKNPYPGATGIITVERYGVLRKTVRKFANSTETVEIPLLPDDVPGVFVSIVVSSPRVDKPLTDGQVDLGKPAYKMAYQHIDVIDPYKTIDVQVKANNEQFKPRETAHIDIDAKALHPNAGERVELAVAMLDEAVFDLLSGGERHFDPYRGFYSLDGLDVANFDTLIRLIGRQKFEKKGADPAGDGGASADTRVIDKYLAYWNSSLITDAKGHAQFDVKLPDNLTGWRILVLATTASDRMGLGRKVIRVSKPTELQAVMPNQISEGDSFTAGFTVMNRTDKARDVLVKLHVEGPIATVLDKSFNVHAEPFARVPVWLPVKSKGPGVLTFVANAGDAVDRDSLQHKVPVNKLRGLLTAANYGSTDNVQVKESILVPKNIFADAGNISMVVSPSVLGNLEGAFEYVRDYPYLCWEQRLTKAMMASDYKDLRNYLNPEFTWPESESIVQDMLDSATSFQAPNGGMVFWLAEDRYVSPYLSAYTAFAFNALRKSGYSIPAEVENKLHAYLQNMLQQNVFPTFYSDGMSSSVRAVALAALAENGEVDVGELRRHQIAWPQMDLFGKAHFMQAALKTAGAEAIVDMAAKDLLSQASESAGKVQFDERWDDSYAQMLATPMRSNCVIMSSLSLLAAQPRWRAKVGDIPFKMVRAITQTRGARTHWENTQENVFCLTSLIDYSRRYESVTPNMALTVMLDNELIGKNTFTSLRDKPVTHKRLLNENDPGQHHDLVLNRDGAGRVYYSARLQYAPTAENAEPVNAGIELRREYSVERNGHWQVLSSPMQLQRGELVRVDLFLTLPTARNFVVVDDPVPGGLEPVNRQLATSSSVDASKGDYPVSGGSWYFHYSDWSEYGASLWSFYHQELRFDSARFYSDYLPSGHFHLAYTAQAIASGEFHVAPTHAEEMYDPDNFGKSVPLELRIKDDSQNMKNPSP